MKYYLATNETNIFHFGEMEEGSILTTGQPKVFYFDTESELKNKVNTLAKDSTYYDTKTNQGFNKALPPINPEE